MHSCCNLIYYFPIFTQNESDVVGDATKEESDEEEDEDEESGRLRFKSERKDSAVVRLSDLSKRRSIPETLGTVLILRSLLLI